MADEPAGMHFDRPRFEAALRSRVLGRHLECALTTESTNDDAWTALATHGHGAAVIALAQSRGRGRSGRAWTQVPGRGLALSVGFYTRAGVRPAGLIPLAAGLAVAQAVRAMGVSGARLKWPNDVRVGDRKLAGVLCEARRTAEGDAVVIGIGMNVRHEPGELPPELRESATSLAIMGCDASLEDAAAHVLLTLETQWDRLDSGASEAILAEWSAACEHWGRPLRVRAPGGDVEGIAERLDTDGALVLRAGGREVRVLAGDVASAPEGARP